MAEQKIAAPFPAPPPFYKHFTKQNLSQLQQLRKEAGIHPPSNSTSLPQPDLDPSTLPLPLRHLLPPPPPTDGKYTSFGVPIDRHAAEPTLSSASIEQLYPLTPAVRLNPQPHLLALARSLLTTFLSLTGILSQDPERYEPAVQDLQTIMYNMHDLINQYRPHQARETLILMMEERVERMQAEVKAVEEAKEKMRKLLAGLVEKGMQLGGEAGENEGLENGRKEAGGVGKKAEGERRERQRAAWKALESAVEAG